MSASQGGQVGKCSSCEQWIETPVLAAVQRGITIAKKASPGQQRPPSHDDVFSFKCQLCGTQLAGRPEQQGKEIPCPDCETRNTVPAPPRKRRQSPMPSLDVVYRLHEGTGQPDAGPSEIAVVCALCETRFHAKRQQIGKHVKCPDCGTATLVKDTAKAKQRKFAPSAEGPLYGVSAPVEVTAPKESTDEVLKKAKARVEEIESLNPKAPARPLLDGVYTYPFYPQSLGIVAILALSQCVVFTLMRELALSGLSPLMVPVAAFTSLLGMAVYMITATVFLTVVEQTANCNDKIEVWPDFNIFDWMFHSLFLFNSFILSFLPGALIEMFISMITGRVWTIVVGGLISTFFFFPPILISMLVENSRVTPFSTHGLVFDPYRMEAMAGRLFVRWGIGRNDCRPCHPACPSNA